MRSFVRYSVFVFVLAVAWQPLRAQVAPPPTAAQTSDDPPLHLPRMVVESLCLGDGHGAGRHTLLDALSRAAQFGRTRPARTVQGREGPAQAADPKAEHCIL